MSKSKPDKEPKKPAPEEKDAPQDGGWRETIESIAMAVILALLFRGFVAEAFVIPTGSMAPTLEGRHKDVWCPKCGKNFQVSCSLEQDQRTGQPTGKHVVAATCPICQYTQRLDPANRPNEGSFSGDRIIVAKFSYDLAQPQRWDVIVFKFPGDATQNYIKRLIGLPNERIRISGGNIYTCGLSEPDEAFRIARKPPHKLNAMLQLVDDTDYLPKELTDIGWPSRWQAWPTGAAWQPQDGGRAFLLQSDPAAEAWLRYRHLVPTHDDWVQIDEQHQLPAGVAERRGQLISDFYAYNTIPPDYAAWDSEPLPFWKSQLTRAYAPPARVPEGAGPGDAPPPHSLGLHWVDDLAVECVADVTSQQGELSLLLVRGGAKYICRINLADGLATLSIVDRDGQELRFDGASEQTPAEKKPVAKTGVKGPGSYRLRLSNCDHQVLLWVNGSVVEFDGPTTYPSDDLLAPQFSAEDPGDLAPAGIGGGKGAAASVHGLRIYRDKYYIATRGNGPIAADYDVQSENKAAQIVQILGDPAQWTMSPNLFESRQLVDLKLEADQFLPLGDNSPASYDGRFWYGENYVERDLLIGKALLIYWPHTWNRPLPFLPNFRKMGPIR